MGLLRCTRCGKELGRRPEFNECVCPKVAHGQEWRYGLKTGDRLVVNVPPGCGMFYDEREIVEGLDPSACRECEKIDKCWEHPAGGDMVGVTRKCGSFSPVGIIVPTHERGEI